MRFAASDPVHYISVNRPFTTKLASHQTHRFSSVGTDSFKSLQNVITGFRHWVALFTSPDFHYPTVILVSPKIYLPKRALFSSHESLRVHILEPSWGWVFNRCVIQWIPYTTDVRDHNRQSWVNDYDDEMKSDFVWARLECPSNRFWCSVCQHEYPRMQTLLH